MTTPYLISDLKSDEGLRLSAYPDPLTHAEPWTIGYGHTGKEVHRGLVWTAEQAEVALVSDVRRVTQSLDTALPWWRTLNDARQDVVTNMGFNLGLTSLLAFHNTLGAMEHGQWEAAAKGMLASKWHAQVGKRAERLAKQMQTGVRDV